MEDSKILINQSSILQLNHVVRNRLNSLLGFVDIVCEDKAIDSLEKERYIKVIKTLSAEIYDNLNEYLDISSADNSSWS